MKRPIEVLAPTHDALSEHQILSAPPLIAQELTRRDLLRLAGASVAALSLDGVPGFVTSAAAQGAPVEVKGQTLQPTHFLAQAALKGAQGFLLGKDPVNIDLNLKSGIFGAVHEFTHSPNEIKLLGRQTSVLEATVITLTTGSSSMKAVQNHLAQHKVPANFVGTSKFIAITSRRRNTTAADRLDLSKQFPIAEQATYLCGFALDAKKQLNVCIILPTFTGPKTKKLVRPGIHFKVIPSSGTPTAPPPPAPPPAETAEEKDFLGCFLPCLNIMSSGEYAGATALACASCIAAIALLPPTAGLDALAGIIVCGGCFFFLGAPIVICFTLCANQL